MAKKDPRTGELITANYGWIKPTVGSSIDAWGGYVNSNFDGIDSVVYGAAARVIGDNRIINGDMRVDARNNGASGTAIGYTVDRWLFSGNLVGKGTWQRNSTTMPGGFSYYLQFTSSSAYTPAAGEVAAFMQRIEADMISDFLWGTSSALTVTLSFWVYSSLTGAFGGSFTNAANNRSYPFTYSIPAANAWTRIVITVPGDTTGTWVLGGNVSAIQVYFDLGSGSGFRGPANAWAGADYRSATGVVNVVTTNGAVFLLTGVKLEIGSVATLYPRQSLAKSLADCQRYYSVVDLMLKGYGTAGMTYGQTVTLPVSMRATPTIAFVSPTYVNASGLALGNGSLVSPGIQAIVTAAGAAATVGVITASAEL